MLDFNKIVNKLLKKGGKVLFKEDIFELIDPEKKDKYKNKVDKIIYRLKSDNIIIPLKAGVYIIPSVEDLQLNKVDLIDKYYLLLLKKTISSQVGNQYFISGKKALEFHLKNNSLPEKIYITTRNLNKKTKVGNYEIIFKTVSGKIEGKKINLFSRLYEYSTQKEIDSIGFKISGLELSLVESALVTGVEEGCDIGLITTAIKKYGSVFEASIFYALGNYKYSMSFNRLKELAKPVDFKLYGVFLDIIKKNGGLFIGEGLRGF